MSRPLPPREKRALMALMNGPIMRENLDTVVGCANGPDLIARLRRKKGLKIPCVPVEKYDKDGKACYPGQYSITPDDKQLIKTLFE